MSTIKLTTFALYRTNKAAAGGHPSAEALYGASDVRFNNGKLELLAASVPFHADRFKPLAPKAGHGLLMLYGIRDSLEELQQWRAKAREIGAEFAYADFEFEVGDIEVGLTDVDLLRAVKDKNRFLNTRRMKSGLQTKILEHFQEYAKQEGQDPDESMSRVSQIANRPDLFDRLFEDYKDMRFLDILVIPVADDERTPPRIRQVAYVRPGAKVVKTLQGRDDVDIVLPAWLTDEKAAKKHRKLAAAELA